MLGGITWGTSNKMEKERKKERGERRVLGQDASGCGYLLHSKQLAGCTEYGMPHNVEGAPREEE